MPYSPRHLGMHLLLAISMLTLLSCTGKHQEHEPNNSLSQANRIDLYGFYDITFSPPPDQDCFKVKVEAPGYLKIQAQDLPPTLKLNVAFFAFHPYNQKPKEKWLRYWHLLPDALSISKPGIYYFILKPIPEDSLVLKPIKIQADLLKEFDPTEPNNQPDQAFLAQPGVFFQSAIFPQGDSDWLKVRIEKPGYIAIRSKEELPSLVLEARYCLLNNKTMGNVNVLRSWHNLPDACLITKPGDYYLELRARPAEATLEQAFELKIDFLEPMDPYEPNSDVLNAKEIKPGESFTLAIFPLGDSDLFKIHIQTGTRLKLFAQGYEDIIPEVSLWRRESEDGTSLQKVGDWQDFPAQFEVNPEKDYYVLIHDKYDDEYSATPFQIKVE